MLLKRVLELIKIEKDCIIRNRDNLCDRQCQNCDLVQDDTVLIAAYNTVEEILLNQINKEDDLK